MSSKHFEAEHSIRAFPFGATAEKAGNIVPQVLAPFLRPDILEKARLRVMEWKRRRAEELKTQQEEQATVEQVRQAEADTEAARKLAATRAEEAERRLVAERERTASATRATEAAEKWAKAMHQREQRRAKIYAINAIMRCVKSVCIEIFAFSWGTFRGTFALSHELSFRCTMYMGFQKCESTPIPEEGLSRTPLELQQKFRIKD